jgi:predicted nucleic acid-binding protein
MGTLMFLLDTNALSELEKLSPNSGFINWFQTIDENTLYISVLTIAEFWEGIARLPQSRKRRELEVVFDLMPTRFSGRILPVDYRIAVRYAEIQANSREPLPIFDTLIAATALVHRLTVITRNTKDLGRSGATVLDPWL